MPRFAFTLLPTAWLFVGAAFAQISFAQTSHDHPGRGAVLSPAGPNPERERRQILESLATACRRFPADTHWAELDACNRAWFRTHEEAVWRLKLNPHGRTAGADLAS